MKRVCWLVVLAAVPSLALADTGTPLMWYGCCWLFVGNALIGVFEAWIIRRRTKLEIGRLRAPVIVANYTSALVGYWLLFRMSSHWEPYVASHGRLLWLMWACAFVLTILIETPFVAFACRVSLLKARPWLDSLIANSASYAVVMPLALVTCFISLATQANLRSDARSIDAPKGWVYYVHGESIRRIRTDGTADVALWKKPPGDGRLFAEPALNGTRADLVWVPQAWSKKPVTLVRGIADAHQTTLLQVDSQGEVVHVWPAERAQQFTEDRSIVASAGFWPAEGLYVQVDKRTYDLAFETPFAAAAWRDPTLLPGAMLIVGLGNKIVLLNLRTRDLAILATGESPAVVLDPSAAPKRSSNIAAW